MTHPFLSAAQLMARVLGSEGSEIVVTEHPISSATDTELAVRAAKAAVECARILTAPAPDAARTGAVSAP